MELEDCLFHLLREVDTGPGPYVEWALLIAAKPRCPGMAVASPNVKGQTLEEEEEQMETDTEVGEPVQVERQKRGRGTKGQTFEEEEEQMEADTEVEKPVQVERQKRGRGTKEQEHKKNEEKRKYEAYEKAKEKNQDEDSSMSNSEKLDKLIQIIHDLGKRVEVIEKVLVVKVPDGSSNKQDYENPANFFDDTKGAPNDENEEEENPDVMN
ncbi:hypothetical protein Bca52824_017834 [Brassica carinata]|uniref:Uncharacterized protein n=1 Tax=Brassica carinata TaxID=52824 RepID=A0A8X8AYS0_BRACI|nr:hypothetical protein Bca52824_017834 [Brassica carinata]